MNPSSAGMESKYNRGADSELCYASVELQNIEDTGVPPSSDRRKRRTFGSSVDDDEEEMSPDNLLNADFRAGSPSLCPVPVISFALPRNLSHIAALEEEPYRSKIYAILHRWEVDITGYGVCLRQPRLYPEDQPILTLLIMAKRRHNLDPNWLRACQQIRSFLSTKGLDEVSVEIADKRAFKPVYCFPVRQDDAIFSVWDKVRDTILREIDLKDWKVLEWFRLGSSEDALNNPPTVMVTVDRDSVRKWSPVRGDIIQILKRFGLGKVAVSIAKGCVYRSTDTSLEADMPQTTWGKKARVGVSLGVHDDNGARSSSATFGGFIELLNENGEWHRFGLTCYHAVLPDTDRLGPT